MANDFEQLYRCLRLSHYKYFFSAGRKNPERLTSTEAFSVEVIYLLGAPTIGEFAEFLGISQPNASYKATSLVAKGYIYKTPCQTDRRECRLSVAPRFLAEYSPQAPNFDALTADFSEADKDAARRLLAHITDCLLEQLADSLSVRLADSGCWQREPENQNAD